MLVPHPTKGRDMTNGVTMVTISGIIGICGHRGGRLGQGAIFW